MKKIMLLLTSVMLVLMTSIAFSALSTSLAITSEVKFRPLADIRVNSIELNNAAGGQLAYESDFSKNTVSNGFTLPTAGSSISYRVHIDNSGDVDYSIYDILKTSSDNGLNVTVSGYNVTDVIPAKSSVDLILTYTTSNPSDTIINVVNTMDFRKVYHVTYETGTNQTIPAQVKYEGVDLTLTNQQPTKNGYTFSKWNTKSDGTGVNYNSGATYGLDEDKTLYARYNLDTYNINYVLNGGTNDANNPNTYTYETPNITLADATKTGYEFKGWTGNGTTTATKNLVLPTGSYGDKTFTAQFADETPPTIEVTNQDKSKNYLTSTYTLNAGWNANTVDVPVYIDAQDVGSGVDKIEYVYSNSTTVPTTGWTETTNGLLTVNKGLGSYYLHVRATDKENNVTTVTTKKITVRYRVAYYDDYSKSTTVTESQYYTGTALTTRTPEAVSGYAFDGWYSSSALTTKVVDANASYTPTTSIKLYGKWTPVTYDITYAMNNGVNNANNPSTYTIESNPIALQAPTKTLIFKGNPNATSGANAASGTVTIGSDTTKAQTFAGWTGSNGTTAQTSVTIPTGSTGDKSYTAHWTAVAGNTPTVTRTGYTCGWSTTSTGTTIEIASGGSFPTSSITEEMAATVNLYAVCTPNTYQLTINPNGGTYNNTTSNSTKTMTYDSSNNNDIGVPTRSGYTFDGWYLAANSKTSQLFDNTGKNTNLSGYFSEAYSTGVWKKTSAVTVYAHWSKVISSLTNSVSSESYIYDGTAKTPTPTVKDGSTTLTSGTDYSVAYTNNTNVGTATATITGKNVYNSTTKSYYTGTDTIHYYINNAKITFDANNCGTISGTSPAYVRKGTTGVYTGIRNSTAGTVPTVTKAGYAFNGWYDGTTKVVNANGTIVAGVSNWTDSSSKWLITADKTLKASCTLSDFSITYAMNNGINNENNTTSYNTADATITLAAPTKTLIFKGNPNATSGANAASGTVTIGSDTTKAQTFAGWTGSNGTTAQTSVTIPTGSTGDKSYTAHWTAVAGTVPTVTRTGYTCGWSTTSTGTTIEIASGGSYATSRITEGMSATVNLYAVCNPDNYTLTINPNGGTYNNTTSNSTKTMTYDSSNNNDIGVPTRDGYTFDGWYLAAENKTSQLFDNTGKNTNLSGYFSAAYSTGVWKKTSAVTVYAHWSKAVTATTNSISPTSYIYDGTAKTPTPTVKDGSTTLTNNTDYSVSYTNNTNVGTATATITGKNVYNSTTKAYYTGTTTINFAINNAKLTFNKGTCDSTSGTTTLYTKKGDTKVYTGIQNTTAGTIPTASKTGYTFQGWYNASSNGTKVLNANGSFTGTGVTNYTNSTSWQTVANQTLYAVCKPNTYTVTANANGGTISSTTGWTGTGNTATKSVTYDSAYGTLPTVARSGYTLNGWNGKNLINIADQNISFTNTYYNQQGSNPKYLLEPNTTYTLSFDYVVNSASQSIYASIGYGSTGFAKDLKQGSSYSGTGRQIITFTTPSSFETGTSYTPYVWFRLARMSTSGSANVDISNVQLEKGDTATTYEPYYITSSTIVKTASNHDINAKWTINNPATPTITGGTTKVYGSSATTLTCATSTDYASGTTKYYSFGYATSDGGTPSNWTTATTTNTLSIAADAYVGQRWYSCRVYATDGDQTTSTVASATAADTEMTINNAKITWDANSCGTISGTSPAYARKGQTGVYTGIRNTTAGTVASVSKSGYTFGGWYDGTTKVINADGTIVASVSNWTDSSKKWLITADKTLKASCTRDNYSITYSLNNGTNNSNNPSTYTVESSDITLAAPTKTLTFKGNANATSGANAASGTVTIGANTTKAQTFAGWSGTGITGNSTSVTIPTGSTGNRSYTAHWTAVAGTTPTVTRTGYTCGWSTTSTGTTIEIASGGSYATSRITEGMAATVNLYAVCTPNTYQLTINPQGGTYNSTTSNSTKTMTYDSTTNNDIGVPTRSGYTFNGWYTAANGGTQVYGSNGQNVNASAYWTAAYSTGTWKYDNNLTVYAHWSKVVTATTNSVSPTSYIYDGTAKSPTPTVKDGSTTLTNNTDYSVAYTNNTNVGTATATITGANVYNSTTKAYYTGTATVSYYINNATITFDANDCGTISGTSPAYVRKGATGVYTGVRNSTAGTMASVSQSGFTFNGWYDGTTKVINANGTIVASVSNWTDASSKWLITADKTLKASCTRADYSITYTMNNGTNNANNPNSYNVESAAITLAAPTKTLTFKGNPNATSGANAASGTVTIGENTTKAQTFAGWTGSNGTTPQTSVTIASGSTGNKSYTAHWTAVAGTVPTVTRTGYTCGWSTTSTGTTIEIASGGSYATSRITEGMAATVNLYAVCNPDTYTLTINPNGGTYNNTTSNSTKTMTYDSSNNNDIGIPTRDGYTFDGWYLAADNKTSQLFDNTGKNTALSGYFSAAYSTGVWKKTSAVTVYAHWSKAVTATTNSLSPTSYIYDGTAKTPTPTVKDGSTTLTNNTDYSVAYTNNTNVGTATATITGKNVYNSTTKSYYTGTATVSYYINNAKITWDTNSCGTISGTSPAYVRKGATGVYTGVRNSTAGTVPTVEKAGYMFNGWYDGTTKVINADGTIVASVSNWTDASSKWLITADKTLKASCTPNTYSVTLDNQGATTAGTTKYYYQYKTTKVVDGVTCYYYTDSALTTCLSGGYNITKPAKTGYTFGGYYTAIGGSGTQYVNASGGGVNNIYQKLPSEINSSYTTDIPLYAKWTINNPATPTISGGATKVYGSSATTLTCSTSTNYVSGTSKYYSFGYATSDGGTPSNWTTATTTNTLSIAADAYVGQRWYSCRVYASDGDQTTSTVASATTADTEMTINNAKITWDANSCGTISGTSPAYVRKGATGVYTGVRNSTAGTMPTVSKTGWIFNGWYDGTTKVINGDGTIVASVSNWTDSSKKWLITADKTLKASCTRDNYTITYTMNNGTNSSSNPTSYNVQSSAITLVAPTKTLTFKGNANATSGANAASGTVTIGSNTTKAQTFAGWSGTGITGNSTSVTIAAGSTGDRSYTAHWTAVEGTLPTVTRTGYTCGWSTSSTGTTATYTSGGTFPTSAITEGMAATVNLYAVCTPNTYTIGYTMNGGPNPSTKPTSGTYDANVNISNPGNKTVTITGNANSTGATVGAATTGTQTFSGWTSSTLGSNAKTGSSTSNYAAWTGSSTKNTYFKNLRESGTVTMVANWSGTATLPTLSKTGYTCKWYDAATGGNEMGASGATWTIPSDSNTSVTAYARCTINSYTLTLNPNGGSFNGTTSNTTVTQNYGTTYSVTNNPTRTGYVFTGWTKSGTGTYNYYDNSSTPTSTSVLNYDSASSTLPNIYNNKGNGSVTRAMVADSTATGGYSLKITTDGEANPNAGGIVPSLHPTTPSRVVVIEVKAKIPSGYNLNAVSGNLYQGTGSAYRSDDRTGNGNWKTYYLVYYYGDTGGFGSATYLYLSGTDNTSVTWYVDYIKMLNFSRENFKSKFTFGAGNGTLTANWATSGSKVSFKPNGGTFNTTYVKSWANGYFGVNATNADRFYRYDTAYGTHPGETVYDWTPDARVISRTGHTFDGWYTAETGGTQIFDVDGKLKASVAGYSDANSKWIKYDSNVTLYARWIPIGYTVTYNTTENGGTGTIASQTVAFGNSIPLPTTGASKSGWTFVGWNTDKNATTALSSLTMGADNVVLYAIYRKEAVTLTANWNANGATLSSTAQSTCTLAAVYNKETQATSCTVTAPTITRANYDVIGFNDSASATTNNSSYNTSTKKLTLTSSNTGKTWYAITRAQAALTATFAANNGATVSTTTASCYLSGTATSCQVDAPTVTPQSGFTHIGFNTNASSTSNNSNYNTSTKKLTISNSGTWYPITRSSSQYSGTFTIQDTNAATQSGGSTSCYRYNGGTSCNITAPTLTAKSGYTAVGWDKTATSSTATYASGASISINGNTQFYSITYYNTTVAITFNRNTTNSKAISQTPKGGTASTEATVIVTCNKMNGSTTCKVTSPTMEVMTGYHAVGYATSASATTSSWNQDTAKDVSTNATYYAITAGNTYSIKFNANCPTTASGSMDDLSMVYGTPKNLTANGFSCSARVFDGWALNAQGTGTSYENEEQVSNLTTTNGATVNLYAKWRFAPPSPTIGSGASKIYGVSATTLTCTENTTYSTPGVNKYYSFGYATSSTGTPSNWSDVSTSNTRTISADAYIGVRYYYCRVYVSDGNEVSDTIVSSNKATMTLKNATITFNANGCGTVANGTSPAYVNTSMTGVYTGITNTTVGTMPSTSKLGYTFTGWYQESELTTKVVNGDGSINASVANWTGADKKWLLTSDKTLYASCSRDTYTITYAMNNGTNNANNPSTYHVESNAMTIQAPTKTLTFKGNYNATSGANASSTSGITIGSDTTKAQTFAGWTGSNGTTAQTSVTIPTGSIGNKNYTAHWTAVAGTVPTVSRTGYTCGWSTSSTGTTVQYASGATFPTSAITEGMSATVNLYAVCTPNTYEITLDKQGGSGGTTTIYETYSVGYYLDAAQTNQMSTSANGITIPTKTNYVFYGYYTEEDGGTEIITSTGKLASGASTTQFSADGTLYARWEPLSYTITYVLNGGTADNPTSYTKETPTFTLTRPEREGYTFVGWTGTGLNATILDVEIAQGSTGNREYTATWTANSYYLNLISLVNSIPVDDIGACGTADVYINGNLVSNDATNYHTAWVTGTTYTISDIKATANSGCTYTGETSYSGTITGANVDVNIPYTFTSRTFNYTGGMQSFKVPATGSYRLEVWGAQGGTSSSHTGGLGGYTNVSKCLTAGTSGDTLYVGVGGTTTTANGGWNGGGCGNGWNSSCDCGAGVSSSDYTQANTVYAAGGGGATHIGTVNAQLRNYASDQRNPNYIFAVAGGGGGGGEANNGGAGGKLNGLDGYGSYKGHGGSSTTSTGGAGGNGMTSANGSFGQGGTANRLQSVASGVSRYWAGGGGGGLYGGGGGDWSTSKSSKSYSGGGGGGSGTQGLPGYPQFGGTGTAGSDGVREGNGQAIITWEGQCNSSQVTYHDITLNYNVNQTFAAPSWMNTYYTPDWSKSFDIDVTFTPGTSGKRYIIFSNYDTSATNAIGLEVNTSNQLRIYVGNSGSPAVDNAFGSVTIGATNTVHTEWNANIGMLTITASGGASGTYVNYIPALTGTGTRSLKFGAFDYREGTSNIFESINVSNFVITEHYASPLSSAYTLPDPAGHYLLFNGWTGSNGNTPQYGVTLASGATSDVIYTANWTGPSSDYTFKSYVSSRYSTKNVATFFQFKVDLSYIDKARRKAYTQEALTFIRTQNFDTTGYSCTISVKYNDTSYSRTFTPALYGNSSLNFWTRSWNNRNNTFEEVNYGSDGTATVSFQLTGLNWHSGSYSPSSFPQTYTITLPSIAPAS